ncbi:MAG: hypothetical protein ACXW3K_07230 [Brevundimonas sp.]
MTCPTTNDNAAATHGPDAHGQAALLLVESVIHALMKRQLITVADAVEIVDVAAEVKVEVAHDLGDSPANLRKSLFLLAEISNSLSRDLP